MAYNAKTAYKLSGITYRQLDHWDRVHFIKPSISEASGSGTVRLYSFEDLVQLKLAGALKEQGLSLQKIRKAVTYLKTHLHDIAGPLAGLVLITDGKGIFLLTEDRKALFEALSGGEFIMAVAVGRIIEELREKAAKIGGERRYSVAVNGETYTVELRPDPEGGGFRVECPALPGCAVLGETMEEALEMIRGAIAGYLEAQAEDRRAKNALA